MNLNIILGIAFIIDILCGIAVFCFVKKKSLRTMLLAVLGGIALCLILYGLFMLLLLWFFTSLIGQWG